MAKIIYDPPVEAIVRCLGCGDIQRSILDTCCKKCGEVLRHATFRSAFITSGDPRVIDPHRNAEYARGDGGEMVIISRL